MVSYKALNTNFKIKPNVLGFFHPVGKVVATYRDCK